MNHNTWMVICAHCGKQMPINGLSNHIKNRHNWKLTPKGEIDSHSNPMWKAETGGNKK